MNILSLESITKGFGAGPVLEGVTFGLEEGERMGIIGRNGSGKTTLLKIIAGTEIADSGRVVFASGRRVAYVPQNPVFEPDKTVLDAVFDHGDGMVRLLHDYEEACSLLETESADHDRLLAKVSDLAQELDVHGGWDLEAAAKAILHKLGVGDTLARVGSLSGGLRKRLALARALILRPDILILDEPTNHLDVDTIAWLEEYLSRYAGALLLVTHDRAFLDRIVRTMLEIEKGQVRRYEGNYTSFLEKKEEQAQQREAEAVKREGMARRELAWLRQGAKARGTKQKAHVERARAALTGPRAETDKGIEISAAASTRLGNKIHEMKKVSRTIGGKTLIRDFSLNLKKGDRIGFIGPNGCGKTTMLEVIAGRLPPDTGAVEIGQNTVIGYYDQESRALDEESTVIDYVRQMAEHIRTADGRTIPAARMLERFLFDPQQQLSLIGRLSGGERRRLYLLRLLMGAPNVLLLDEPSNDFDILTLEALEVYLETFDGCLIVASHDRWFLDRTVDQVFRFEENGSIRGYPGNYSAYLEIRKSEAGSEAVGDELKPEAPRAGKRPGVSLSHLPSPARVQKSPDASGKLSFKERRELEELEKAISQQETRKSVIEAQLADPPGDHAVLGALTKELNTLTEKLDRDIERWGELASKQAS